MGNWEVGEDGAGVSPHILDFDCGDVLAGRRVGEWRAERGMGESGVFDRTVQYLPILSVLSYVLE